MNAPPFGDRLVAAVEARGSSVVVGLDPHLTLLPPPFADGAASLQRNVVAAAVERFCDEIVETVADLVPAIKPQIAFFERLGPPGWTALERVVQRAKRRGLLVVADAKRGDIGSTATAYADYLLGGPDGLGGLDADAVTVNPYLGTDSLLPFAAYLDRGKGLFVLAKTSNPSSAELQDRLIETAAGERPLYTAVAELARQIGADSRGERGFSSVGIVVGATHPSQLGELRGSFSELPFLVPGFGAQGADADDVTGAFDERGLGALVNASRSLLFAYRGEEYSGLAPKQWSEATRRECKKMSTAINEALAGVRKNEASDRTC